MLKSVTEARLPAILSDNYQKYILTPGKYITTGIERVEV